MNWKTSDKKCLVIAHRGDTKMPVENTLPAIESALKLGVDGIEVDLRLTRDEEIVIFHDENLMRLAGRNLRIEDSNLHDLKSIRFNGTPLPTLEELLDLVGTQALLNLEIKTLSLFSKTLENKLLQHLNSFHLGDSILISSFHPLPLWRLRRMAPKLARGYLFESRPSLHSWIIPWISPFSVNAPLTYTSRGFVDGIHQRGRRFFVWTVNDETDMKRVIEEGADGIITDEPRKLLALLQRHLPTS